ncbi:hypothetical protein EV130_111148 [Rhizobium azibense]|uniref:Uncharacterized protein n=1 Tax=Rhizobium azibense TaxID=1136135 RepID=A0A4R3QIA0_9HYPH|nr:hypothetical protein EV130_111148 [Rhizobium azibense]TCU32599.1 hypothetical protein EV129_11946 [Rhizobium azibense]
MKQAPAQAIAPAQSVCCGQTDEALLAVFGAKCRNGPVRDADTHCKGATADAMLQFFCKWSGG